MIKMKTEKRIRNMLNIYKERLGKAVTKEEERDLKKGINLINWVLRD